MGKMRKGRENSDLPGVEEVLAGLFERFVDLMVGSSSMLFLYLFSTDLCPLRGRPYAFLVTR
jgi:hypothetical protein